MAIEAITVPKWGLEMEEGTLVEWHIEEGDAITEGEDLVEIETEKVANVVEAPASGTLVRRIGEVDETYAVGTLLGVIADANTDGSEIEEFIAQFEATESTRSDGVGGPQPEFVDVDGHRIRYLRLGEEGDPVVFLHGFAGDLQNWMFVQPEIAADHVTIAIDLPGHGGSGKALDGIEGLVGMADIVAGMLKALDFDEAHLVGHSMGGEVALNLAARNPDRVSSLTLLAPTGTGPLAESSFVDGFVSARRNREMKSVIEMLFTDPAMISRDLIDNLIKYKRLDGVKDALDTLAAWLKEPSNVIESVAEVPMAIIWGKEDQVVLHNPDMALPSTARLVLMDAMGHMAHLEAPQEVARVIRSQLG